MSEQFDRHQREEQFTYGFRWVEIHSRDGTPVSGELEDGRHETSSLLKSSRVTYLVLHLSALNIPDAHCPVSTSNTNPLASVVAAPCSPQQRVLKSSWRTCKDAMDTRRRWREGPYVVNNSLAGKRWRE